MESKDKFGWPASTSHLQCWLFESVSKLRERQEEAFNSALERIKGNKHSASAKETEAELPTYEEEAWLVQFYSFQLSRFLSANHMKDAVKQTALTFFNRFYVTRSMLEYDPRVIMFTCVTLAIKLEDMWKNYFVDKLLGTVEGLDIAKVFEMEAIVCDALNFNFLVLHTADSMHTIRLKCMEYIKEKLGIDDEILGEHLGLILSVCNDAQKDAVHMYEDQEFIFLYTPTQLAVANFARHSQKRLGELLSVDQFLLKKLVYDNVQHLELLNKVIQSINDRYEQYLDARCSVDEQEKKAGTTLDKYLSLYK